METTVLERPARRLVPTRDPRHRLPRPAAVSIALSVALLAGMLTKVGHGTVSVLGDLAHSSGACLILMTALVLLARPRIGRAMLLGAMCAVLTHVGYVVAAALGGRSGHVSLADSWLVLAIPAGGFAGIVATWVRARDTRRRSLVLGAVGAVLVGEGVRAVLGVAVGASTTLWMIEIGVGVLLVGAAVVTGRTPVARVMGLGAGVIGAAAVLTAYQVVLGA